MKLTHNKVFFFRSFHQYLTRNKVVRVLFRKKIGDKKLFKLKSTFFFSTLALLSATLRTYQKTGCDSELVTLSCPRGTSISIDVAQYGKPGNGEFLFLLIISIYIYF